MTKSRREPCPIWTNFSFFIKIFHHKMNLCMYLEPEHHRKCYKHAIQSCIGVLYSLIIFNLETELAMFRNIQVSPCLFLKYMVFNNTLKWHKSKIWYVFVVKNGIIEAYSSGIFYFFKLKQVNFWNILNTCILITNTWIGIIKS